MDEHTMGRRGRNANRSLGLAFAPARLLVVPGTPGNWDPVLAHAALADRGELVGPANDTLEANRCAWRERTEHIPRE
jgi:hypothetical protein